MDLDSISFGVYKDGGTSSLSTIIDLTTLTKECREAILNFKDNDDIFVFNKNSGVAKTSLEYFANAHNLNVDDLIILKLTYPCEKSTKKRQIYMGYHSEVVFVEVADEGFLKILHNRIIKFQNSLDKSDRKYYLSQEWLKLFKSSLRNYSINKII